LTRIHVEAADQDHLLLAVDDGEIPIFVELADIAGVKPAVADRVCRFFWTIAVAHHHLRAFEPDFAGLSHWENPSAGFEIDDLDRRLRHRQADGAHFAPPPHRIAGDGRRFGHADALED